MASRQGTRSATGDVKLVVVESPNKARTISNYLGDGYIVESSIGHIRDLPRGAADVPAKYKGEPWARLGVDTEHGFQPLYIVTPDKKAQVAKLKSLLAGASELYLATDEDREGEAIAWHLLETLNPKVPVKRMVFHEITPAAIRAAAESPRELDENLVDAQETRRILDRLYGYEVSPVLWKKVMPKLSAGRVQSVATRIIVERERERMRFVSGSYWGLDGKFTPTDVPDGRFTASLATVDGRRLASGRDFDPSTGAAVRGRRPGRRAPAGRGRRPLAGRTAGRRHRDRHLGRGQAVHPQALPAVHDLDHAAGGRTQARLLRRAHHAGGAEALRVRLHHLHADRLDHAEQDRAGRGQGPGPRAVRAGVPARRAAAVHQEGQERPGGARGHPARPATRSAPRGAWPARSADAPTSSGCTS